MCKENNGFIAQPVKTGSPLAQEQNRITHNCLFQVHFFIIPHGGPASGARLLAGGPGANIG